MGMLTALVSRLTASRLDEPPCAGGERMPQGAANPEPASSERGLVTRARSGDSEAFRTIFDRYAQPIRRFLRDLLRDPAAADEATQETFVRAHRQLGALRDGDRVASWLFGIARFVAMEQLRARRRHPSAPAEAAQETASRQPTPEAALLAQESDALLGAALAALDEDRRAALLLRIDHELGYEDIAQAMGWTMAKVKNEIHRARLELRAQLLPYLGGQQ
jgi:RNA polymerase sigma-70 factor (ECF subfamily)